MDRKCKAFEELLNIMVELREKCPWDRKQTMETLRPLTIEETYELCDAVMKSDISDIKKELGDLIMHITFYARIAEEQGLFDIGDVLNSVCEKLKYRHPHIYGDVQADSAQQVSENWEKLKLKEGGRGHKVLEGVPASLPSLVKALRLQEKAAGVGFDWGTKEEVWDKVREEVLEFQTEVDCGNAVKMEEEFGDLLFSLVNMARKYGINPDNALEKTNNKFISRFNYVEDNAERPLPEMSLEEMDELWNEAKGR